MTASWMSAELGLAERGRRNGCELQLSSASIATVGSGKCSLRYGESRF